MSKTLDINGTRFESSASIAGRFNYTQDYIGRLAREGKVEATKIGRLWFVNVASFETFIAVVEKDKERRSEALRKERQAERAQTAVVEKSNLLPRKNKKDERPPASLGYIALAQTVAVLACGVLVGSLGWLVHSEDVQVAHVYSGVSVIAQQLQQAVAIGNSKTVASTYAPNVARREMSDVQEVQETHEVFAVFPEFSYAHATTTEARIVDRGTGIHLDDYFSDEVDVYVTEDGQQVVRPVFVDAQRGEEFVVSVQRRKENIQ